MISIISTISLFHVLYRLPYHSSHITAIGTTQSLNTPSSQNTPPPPPKIHILTTITTKLSRHRKPSTSLNELCPTKKTPKIIIIKPPRAKVYSPQTPQLHSTAARVRHQENPFVERTNSTPRSARKSSACLGAAGRLLIMARGKSR